ncbi:NAD(P)-dependent alcohol dehydrogenase [Autumnicola psychrophila]|uniref:NAD(P)-dependent alcohol dehydrogenase n=1 Tax=Autumnicola psychrophila TaxID=3075592 RepID=A0ABU3DVM8_9FLAO|nr:NAD(P)-dependent alcohol dehydrogenase [Zunongwangia sp. F225]MDT0687759.1 NAD(P)-dependent alcohol dehydrogenase [Zunongwangia sp. F225]
MKAVTREKYGQSNVLQIKEVEKPVPKENEVLIRVHFTTINRTDCGILTGKPYIIRFFTGLLKPSSIIPGTDFAGQVVERGVNVNNFNIGDKVWGFNDQGLASHAEYMAISENGPIATIPGNLAYDEVVACAEGAHYAYNFINKVHINKADKVLVNGATGAIGSAALQILKSLGIYVTAVGNSKNIELLKSLGADKTYSYEKEDFSEIDREKYHFIFDAVGKSSFEKCKELLLPKGVYISSELGRNSENLYLPLVTKLKGTKRVIFPIPSNCKRSILYINDLIEKDRFKPIIDRYFKPEEIKKAYDYVQSGQKTGNVIITFSSSENDLV